MYTLAPMKEVSGRLVPVEWPDDLVVKDTVPYRHNYWKYTIDCVFSKYDEHFLVTTLKGKRDFYFILKFDSGRKSYFRWENNSKLKEFTPFVAPQEL